MKIIKEGKKMITGTMNVTCTTCEAELEINVNDLTGNNDLVSIFYFYICPCCSQKNWVTHADLTKEMLSDLRKRINP